LRERAEYQTIRRFVITSSPRSPLLPFVSSTEFIESIWNSPLRFSSALQASRLRPCTRSQRRGRDMSVTCRGWQHEAARETDSCPRSGVRACACARASSTHGGGTSKRISRSCHIAVPVSIWTAIVSLSTLYRGSPREARALRAHIHALSDES
jgi:hypothetical protein